MRCREIFSGAAAATAAVLISVIASSALPIAPPGTLLAIEDSSLVVDVAARNLGNRNANSDRNLNRGTNLNRGANLNRNVNRNVNVNVNRNVVVRPWVRQPHFGSVIAGSENISVISRVDQRVDDHVVNGRTSIDMLRV
jgi:hypothetical protein